MLKITELNKHVTMCGTNEQICQVQESYYMINHIPVCQVAPWLNGCHSRLLKWISFPCLPHRLSFSLSKLCAVCDGCAAVWCVIVVCMCLTWMGLSYGLPFVPCCRLKVVWVLFLSVLASFLVSQHQPFYPCRAMHVPSAQQCCLQQLATPLEYTPTVYPPHTPLLPLFTPGNNCFPWNCHPLTPSSLLACVVCGLVSTYPSCRAAEEEGENIKRLLSSTSPWTAFQGQR